MFSLHQCIIVFGLPGAGKTYVGKILQKHFNHFFYDGDNDLTDEMKQAIATQSAFTEEMRDIFFKKLLESTCTLERTYKKVVITQTFIKEKYRNMFQEKIPSATFLLVETDSLIREKRLGNRHEYPLDIEYSQQMVKNFETPQIPHHKIVNNEEGEEDVKKQLQEFVEILHR